MPGAWEVGRPEVLVATLTRELVATKWAMGYRALQLPPSARLITQSGAPFDEARNACCETALQGNFEWLFFLDDDVVPPPDVFFRLKAHGADIISGLYYRRAPPIVPVMMYIDKSGQAQWVDSWNPPNSTIEVDLVGAGCLLIHRRVLLRLQRRWFEWQMGRDTGGPRKFSEDFAFCQKAKAEFFKIYVDTSIKCEHIGLGKANDSGFSPSSL